MDPNVSIYTGKAAWMKSELPEVNEMVILAKTGVAQHNSFGLPYCEYDDTSSMNAQIYVQSPKGSSKLIDLLLLN